MLLREWIQKGDVVLFGLSVMLDGSPISVVNPVRIHTTRYDEKADIVHVDRMFADGSLESTQIGDEYWADSNHREQRVAFQLGPVTLTIWRKWSISDLNSQLLK